MTKFSLLTFALACYIFVTQLIAKDKGDKLEQHLIEQLYTPYAMTKLPTGHDLVKAIINGRQGTFILDTGAISLIDERLLGEFKIKSSSKIETIEASGVGGAIRIKVYPIENFQMAGKSIAIQKIGATDLSAVSQGIFNSTGVLIDGLIGQDFLISQHAVIDVASKKLYFLNQDKESPLAFKKFMQQQGYLSLQLTPLYFEQFDMTYLASPAQINGQQGLFIIDSGASRSMLHSEQKAKYQLDKIKPESNQESSGAGGAIQIQNYSLNSFKLQSHMLTLETIRSSDLSSVINMVKQHTSKVVDGIIGQDLLTQYHAVIDVAGQQLYIKQKRI